MQDYTYEEALEWFPKVVGKKMRLSHWDECLWRPRGSELFAVPHSEW